MTVREIWTGKHDVQVTGVGYNAEGVFNQQDQTIDQLPDDLKEILRNASLCNDSSIKSNKEGDFSITGDLIEVALLVATAKAGYKTEEIRKKYKRLDVIP